MCLRPWATGHAVALARSLDASFAGIACCGGDGQFLHLDLDRAPYVLYGVKYIDLVSLCCGGDGQFIKHSNSTRPASICIRDVVLLGWSDPGTFSAGAHNQNTSRIQNADIPNILFSWLLVCRARPGVCQRPADGRQVTSPRAGRRP